MLKQVAAPTLVLWGEQDRILGGRSAPECPAERFTREMPDARLVWLPDWCGRPLRRFSPHLLPLPPSPCIPRAAEDLSPGFNHRPFLSRTQRPRGPPGEARRGRARGGRVLRQPAALARARARVTRGAGFFRYLLFISSAQSERLYHRALFIPSIDTIHMLRQTRL